MPTIGNVLEDHEVHPQGGLGPIQLPLGREYVLQDVATSRIGITVNAPQAVNAVATLHFEE